MSFRRWQFRAEVPSAPGKWEVYYPTTNGERRQRFTTEVQAYAFAKQMGGRVVPVTPRGGFVLKPCR